MFNITLKFTLLIDIGTEFCKFHKKHIKDE